MGGTSDTSSRGVVEEDISRPTSPAQNSTADEETPFLCTEMWRDLSDVEVAYALRRFEELFDYELPKSGQLSESGSLKTWPNSDNASRYWVNINEDYYPGEYGRGSNEGPLERGMDDSVHHPTISTQIILDHVCQTYYSLVSLRHRPVDPYDAASWRPTRAEFDGWANEFEGDRSARAALELRSKLLQLTSDDPSLAVRLLKSEAMWIRRPGAPQDPSATQGIHRDERYELWGPAWTLSEWSKAKLRPDRKLARYEDGPCVD